MTLRDIESHSSQETIRTESQVHLVKSSLLLTTVPGMLRPTGTSAPPGRLLEMHILGPQHRPPESGTVGCSSVNFSGARETPSATTALHSVVLQGLAVCAMSSPGFAPTMSKIFSQDSSPGPWEVFCDSLISEGVPFLCSQGTPCSFPTGHTTLHPGAALQDPTRLYLPGGQGVLVLLLLECKPLMETSEPSISMSTPILYRYNDATW